VLSLPRRISSALIKYNSAILRERKRDRKRERMKERERERER
jgi:hypothetical protein